MCTAAASPLAAAAGGGDHIQMPLVHACTLGPTSNRGPSARQLRMNDLPLRCGPTIATHEMGASIAASRSSAASWQLSEPSSASVTSGSARPPAADMLPLAATKSRWVTCVHCALLELELATVPQSCAHP